MTSLAKVTQIDYCTLSAHEASQDTVTILGQHPLLHKTRLISQYISFKEGKETRITKQGTLQVAFTKRRIRFGEASNFLCRFAPPEMPQRQMREKNHCPRRC